MPCLTAAQASSAASPKAVDPGVEQVAVPVGEHLARVEADVGVTQRRAELVGAGRIEVVRDGGDQVGVAVLEKAQELFGRGEADFDEGLGD